LPVRVAFLLVAVHELVDARFQPLHLDLDGRLYLLGVEVVLYFECDVFELLPDSVPVLFTLIVDELVDCCHDVALPVCRFLVFPEEVVDEGALLHEFFVVFVELVIEFGDDLLAVLEFLHEVLYFGFEVGLDELVDFFVGEVAAGFGGAAEGTGAGGVGGVAVEVDIVLRSVHITVHHW
jgi:hypothetical protein